MKITAADYSHMLTAIQAIAPKLAAHRERIKDDPRIQDLEKRMRWDAFYGAGLTRFACDTLYVYCDDSHIDTALRSIMREVSP